ncbi:hypothetical protein [Eggerthia catenaformis]
MLLYFSVLEDMSDFIRWFLWGMISTLMHMIQGMLTALCNGILSFSILQNPWVEAGYKGCLILFFIILPVKLIYEVFSGIIRDDEASLDWSKKLFNAILAIMLVVSMPTVIVMGNNIMVDITNTISTVDMNNTDKTTGKSNKDLGTGLFESVFIGFGGMSSDGPYSAEKLVKRWKAGDRSLDVNERVNEDNWKNKVPFIRLFSSKGNHVWAYQDFMVVIGLLIYIVLLFVISIQIAHRLIIIGFCYTIAPLPFLSMTNTQNPQAANVWKSTILGQYAINFTQMFLLSLVVNLVPTINKISIAGNDEATVYAKLIMYFASFLAIVSIPPFIQALFGGWNAGVMEAIHSARGAMSTIRGATIGAVAAGIGKTIGTRSAYTGNLHGGLRGAVLGNKQKDGTRMGGVVGATIGRKDANSGYRQGGLRGAMFGNRNDEGNLHGGLRGAVFGNKSPINNSDMSSTDNDHVSSDREQSPSQEGYTRSGGLYGLWRGTTTTTFDETGQKNVFSQGGIKNSIKNSFANANRQSTGSNLSHLKSSQNDVSSPDKDGGYTR